MMGYRIFFFVMLFTVFGAEHLFAQQIKVLGKADNRPVENVYIFNNGQNKMVSTNAEGEANLAKFAKSDTLNFQHPAYKPFVILYEELARQNFRVLLEEQSVNMDEIFVSASRREQDITEIPQPVAQINEEQMRFGNPQTSADLLQNSGKVFVQKSQMGGGSPMIRGFAANSVLLAVDGVRMNNAIFRSGNLQNVISVDPNTLENTEVLFGSGSIIYGSDALGGVMNFQTKSPELSPEQGEIEIGANIMGRYSSANNERTYYADASFGFEKWGLLTSVRYSNFDDLRSGGDFYDAHPDFGKRTEYVVRQAGEDRIVENDKVTLQRFSGYDQLNLMQKFRYKPSSNLNASYGFHYATSSDIPRYDRLIEREQGDTGDLVNAEWYYGPQIWMMNNLNVEYIRQTSLFNKASIVLSQQWFQESRNDRDFGDVNLRNREENVNVYIANLDFDKLWGEDQALYYGVESIYNYVGSQAHQKNIETGEKNPVATRYPDQGSDYSQLAGYTKYQHDFNSQLTAVAGVRYSHVILHSEFSDQFYDFPFDEIDLNTGALSGSLGFTYRPLQGLQFSLNGSTGFRAPNVDDAAKVFDSEPGTVVVPNADLDPEKSYNIDFSIIKNFNNTARFEVNTYYTWLKDAMVRRPFEFNGQQTMIYDGEESDVEAVVNAGEAYIYGGSVGFETALGADFSLNSQLTYTYGRDISNDEPLRHVAPLFGLVSLTYHRDRFKVETYTEFNAKKDISDFSPSERNKSHLYTPEGTPGWATLNVKSSYQFNEQIQLNMGVENILDKHYRLYSSGISAPGRNIMVTLRAQL